MTLITLKTTPFDDQKLGTSGLRKKVKVFSQPHYLENFIQSLFNALGGVEGADLVIGGDGRFYNRRAIQIILKMAAANGVASATVGRGGLLSTPAASNIIRKYKKTGGIILSASHNPAGENGDFGIKYNSSNGGPAPEKITDAIFDETKKITAYKILEVPDVDMEHLNSCKLKDMGVHIIDPVEDYQLMMEEIFDFDAIRELFASGFSIRFDAMNAITGPYAKAILEGALGAADGSVVNAVPLHDFGGLHPDPNPVHAKALFDLMHSDNAPNFGAASDGDGDRNIVLGKNTYAAPSDSLAVLTANAHLAPGYVDGIKGVARSMPTSAAVDRVAKSLDIPCFETPTGWKFFGNLLDAGEVTLCGEESAGTGSDHVREKDGLWAVLLWLNIVAASDKGVPELMTDHWAKFGRNFYSRHDYEGLDLEIANKLIADLRGKIPSLAGKTVNGLKIVAADDFCYTDPVDGSVSSHQGVRIYFKGDSRIIFRLSGTGTEGATLRVYLEQYEGNRENLFTATQDALAPLIAAADEIANISSRTGRLEPSVIS